MITASAPGGLRVTVPAGKRPRRLLLWGSVVKRAQVRVELDGTPVIDESVQCPGCVKNVEYRSRFRARAMTVP